MKQQEDFSRYPITNSKIEEWYWCSSKTNCSLCIEGKYNKTENIENKYCYYSMYFNNIKDSDTIEKKEGINYQNATIVQFERNEVDCGVEICLTISCGSGDRRTLDDTENLDNIEKLDDIENLDNTENLNNTQTLQFCCENIHYNIFSYKGKSYKNVYFDPKYQELFVKNRQSYSKEECFLKAESKDLENGYLVQSKSYGTCQTTKNGIVCKHTFIQRCCLLYEGTSIFEYDSIYDMARVCAIIKHQNGKSYFLFKTDLYGLNVYDMQSKEVFSYVPEGYQHHYQQICGESFIITNIYYDDKTNWIAYEGCYWGGSIDVMVGDFSNPMNFNPVLKSVHDWLDPEWEYCDDVTFDKWEDGKLYIMADGKNDVVEVKALFE